MGLGSGEGRLGEGAGHGRSADPVGVAEADQFEEERFFEGDEHYVFGVDGFVGIAELVAAA